MTQVPTSFRRRENGEEPGRPETRVRAGTRHRSPRALLCAACGTPVTSDEDRIAMAGRHEHRCVNPHGILFHIGCFRSAPGCRVWGAATTEFTWFPGFAWRYAECKNCGVHLGWLYEGEAESFFGLILARLAQS